MTNRALDVGTQAAALGLYGFEALLLVEPDKASPWLTVTLATIVMVSSLQYFPIKGDVELDFWPPFKGLTYVSLSFVVLLFSLNSIYPGSVVVKGGGDLSFLTLLTFTLDQILGSALFDVFEIYDYTLSNVELTSLPLRILTTVFRILVTVGIITTVLRIYKQRRSLK